MNYVELPVYLPFDLVLTNYGAPYHMDLAPVIQKTPETRAAYVAAFFKLAQHVIGGVFRFNYSETCWHYHYRFDPLKTIVGLERTNSDGKGHCKFIDAPDVWQVDLSKYGAREKLSALMDETIKTFIPDKITYAKVVVSPWRFNKIYFDPAMISQKDMQIMANVFTAENTLADAGAILPGSFQDQKRWMENLSYFAQGAKSVFNNLPIILTIGAAIYFAYMFRDRRPA